ncbi:Nitroreductase-like protein [Talaromyces proteolyticus]|uniref:Nitroreductase-like protein n=1 Tax=Talaromyces proteolyticus TaxID=1131652 RepID=A0AAD4KLR9_9EURO|nr:Nitroreductase-like protein [Talaromyces proteolyticus]KAH8691407.1 Nitroreductase-like protein [Talaromyces proteolyticus]
MADSFFSTIQARRSIYAISAASPIPDSRIIDLVQKAVLHVPSSYNVQSARAVVILKEDHKKLWEDADSAAKAALPEAVYGFLAPRITGFKGGYGSVLFFESQEDLDGLAAQHQAVAPFVTEWSDTSSGMHQFAVWTALKAEGLGASLQHFNFLAPWAEKITEDYKLPKDWKLKAQLVFGTPTGGPAQEKTFKPIEERVKVFGQ